MTREDFIDYGILQKIFFLNVKSTILLFVVAYILFIYVPRRIFPQKYTGGGIENIISNIIYMLVFIELSVPLMVFLKIFNTFTFMSALIITKLFFVKFYEHKEIKSYLRDIKNRTMIAIFDFFDHYHEKIEEFKKRKKEAVFLYFKHLDYYQVFKKILIFAVFAHLVYILGYRCFIALANPLPDTSQFFEWVANLQQNILYADNKTAKADFYGISVFIFILRIFTHLDTIVLFNIYPLLLIIFLLLGVYFVLKRFSVSSLIALFTLLIYGSFLIGSPWNSFIATPIALTENPEIIRFFSFKIYQVPSSYLLQPHLYLENIAMTPLMRYFSGMAYEFSSAFYLLNLFYLIKSLDTGKTRYLFNYTFTLMLVFIFHGGGAIALIVPSIFIALHALLSGKLSISLLKRGFVAIFSAAILGNGWVLSVLKYGIPQDFGNAAPFLDRLFHTKQAIVQIATAGIEEVTISYLTWVHLFLVLSAIAFFLIARVYKKGFYFSSFLLIPLGFFVVYYAENIGFPKLVHPSRGAEYLFLSITIIIACYIKLFLWVPLKLLIKRYAKYIFMMLLYVALLFSAFVVEHYKNTDEYRKLINGVQYSDIPYFLYKIIRQNKPLTWTVVSYVQEYSKVLGKGYMVNTNEFIIQYNPLDKFLKIPTPKVYIFVEDIPHKYTGKDQWYYRWRKDIQDNLKHWIALYSAKHDNIKIFARSHLVTVYEIDNSGYIKNLERINREQHTSAAKTK
ncbi:hypothetical protein NitYY0813_C1510 [Nitratiruptor sp. YY08-13]|uniref:hypothetical protein n=1 Tax=Nitratiruptor sp. YY08-13 TaxID=2724898 RepID=UPI00191687CE|nr:hypothetical protein [Nitratiruptor sp. YY08-13]BCD62630.1 hypothetical protein NitYY0813_C1510 [Nitratiruptor sp. YY08-13]